MPSDIGLIGIGKMGSAMVERLNSKNFSLVIYNSISEAAVKFQGSQFIAESPMDVAQRSTTIILSLPDSDAVEEVVFGKNGLVEGFQENTLVVDMGSSNALRTINLANRLKEKGIKFIDAPVSGGPRGARSGTLSIMVGGNEEDIKPVTPILQALGGENVVHVGKVGSGHILKSLNNMLFAISIIATSEAMSIGVQMGLNPEIMLEVLERSSGRNRAIERTFPQLVLAGNFEEGMFLRLLHKDILYALDVAKNTKTPVFLGTLAQEIYRLAEMKGLSEEADYAVVKIFEEISGVKIRR